MMLDLTRLKRAAGSLWRGLPFIVHNFVAVPAATVASMLLLDPVLELPTGSGLLLLAVVVVVWFGGLMGLQQCLLLLLQLPFGRLLATVQLFGELALAVVLIGHVIPLVNPDAAKQRAEEQLGPEVARYAALEPIDERARSPSLKGQCVVVATDQQGNTTLATDVLFNLRPSVRATAPEEVTTVIQLRFGTRKIEEPPGAELETCEVRLLELATRRLLGLHHMEGQWREVHYKNRPPFWTGTIERHQIWAYLREVPCN